MIDAHTRLMGLIGDPLDHSSSPLIHNHISSVTGVNIAYLCFRTANGELWNSVFALEKLGAKGFNVTIPYKTAIISYLDFADESVERSGACNTVKISDGRLYGYNTDIDGFYEAFAYDTGKGFENRKVCVLGAGGAGRGVAYSVLRHDPGSLAILNRNIDRAEKISRDMSGIGMSVGCGVLDGTAEDILSGADIIINTTSAGMYPDTDDDPLCFFDGFTGKQTVYDIIYNPAETKLVRRARMKGAAACNGLSMLIIQAVLSFEIINGVSIDSETRSGILKDISEKFKNGGKNED